MIEISWKVSLPATWQLQPPKPSLQWHRWSRHTPLVHFDPSSASQSSVWNQKSKITQKSDRNRCSTYLNISALSVSRQSPCNNLGGHRRVSTAHRFAETLRTRWPDSRSIHLPSSGKILRVGCRKGFFDSKIVNVPAVRGWKCLMTMCGKIRVWFKHLANYACNMGMLWEILMKLIGYLVFLQAAA